MSQPPSLFSANSACSAVMVVPGRYWIRQDSTVVVALGLGGLLLFAGAAAADAAPPTFTRDIAPLIWQKCGGCHRPGDLAPFSLIEYRDVAPRARQIVAVTRSHRMPPWLPEPGPAAFAGDRRLSDGEVERIAEWVKDGAPEGDRADLPPRPVWNDGWQLGTPDLVVQLAQPFTVRAGDGDVFRNFVIPLPLLSSRYVRGIEVRPGNRQVIHHASIAFDRTRESRRLDEADPEPGFAGGMFSESARNPESRALGWTPGITPALEPPEMAWRLEQGSDLVLLLHLMAPATGQPQKVQPSIGFYFSDMVPSRTPVDFKLGSKEINIPAGRAGYAIDDRYTLPVDVDVLSIYPHAHYLAKEMKVTAIRPDGSEQVLISIKDWDFHWQDQYRYQTPVSLPRGSEIRMHYTYDNSVANKRNPARVPSAVRYGPQSSDEMGDLWLRLLPRTVEDAAVLARSYREHELVKDLATGEQGVAAAPDDAKKRNALGAAYIELGRIAEGVFQLEQALRLAPDNAEAHNNLGHAQQLQGRTAEAIVHFREAVRLAPANDLVHLNLGNALQDTGEMEESIAHLTRAIELNPSAAEAHNNLGVALGSTGRIDEAINHFQAALALQPDYQDAKDNLAMAVQLKK